MRAIPRYKLVYVTIPAGTTAVANIPFPDIPELRDCPIIGLEAYDTNLLTNTPDQVPVIANGDSQSLVVVLKDASNERVQEIPYCTLITYLNAGIWKQFDPFVVNWQSSVLRVLVRPGALPVSAAFGVFYLPSGTGR